VVPSRAPERPTTTGIARATPRRSVVARDVATALLAVLVVAGLTGFLGDRLAVVRDDDGVRSLAVTYAPVARNGAGLPWRVELHDPRGLPPEIDLAISTPYLDMLDHQRFYPEPVEETRSGDELVLTFATDGSASFVLEHDSYVQPRWTPLRDGTVSLLEDGRPALTVSFRTVLAP